ncbi:MULTISPECIES: Rv3235 family protein [unclassified Aeromicrobium]|uniref:Rv3235 family protein n=1 Tax=unclassified Aeromicrobium TaxID=2633570 RepID=UPI00396B3C3F
MITATALATDPFAPRQVPLPFTASAPLLPVPVERGDASELRHRCARFTQALAEVITGIRPVRQLGPWLSRDVYEQLHQYVADRFVSGGPRHSPRVVSVHIAMVEDGAAEIAARMVHRGRSHALAVRLQRGRDPQGRATWRCTAAEWA